MSSSAMTTFLTRRAWLLALLVAIPVIIPLLRPGWFEGHDDFHIFRLIEYDAALRDGQIPPRWFPDIHGGRGNPHPIYYAPLFYMAAELFHLAGFGLVGALKAALILATLGASIAMFRYARLFFDPPAALVSAAAYTYIPYHLLDLYVRQAFSEYSVFVFLPLMLHAIHRLRFKGTRFDLVLAALAIAAMSVSHTITTMLVPPILLAYACLLSLPALSATRAFEWRWLRQAWIAAVIGYAIAGWFLVPAFLERDSINLAVYTEGYLDFHKHFVHPLQLLWSEWGFGISLEGLKDGISFRLGFAAIAGTILAAVGLPRLRHRSSGRVPHVVFFLLLAALALLMTTSISTAIWETLPPLRFLQFPWRFLTLTTLSMGFLCGAAWQSLTGAAASNGARAWTGALVLCALLPVTAAAGGLLDVNRWVLPGRIAFTEKMYLNLIDAGEAAAPVMLDSAYVRGHTLHWIDHLPPGVSHLESTSAEMEGPRVIVESGEAAISRVSERTASLSFHLTATSPSRVRVNVYAFPGWAARMDGAPLPIEEPARRPRLIRLEVPAGDHDVSLAFERTPARRLGDGLTLAGLASLALAGLFPSRR